MYFRALAGYEKALEPEHPDTLRVVHNLGMLYHGRGQIKQAEGNVHTSTGWIRESTRTRSPRHVTVTATFNSLIESVANSDDQEISDSINFFSALSASDRHRRGGSIKPAFRRRCGYRGRRLTRNWCGDTEPSSGQRSESARGGRHGCRKWAAW
jgi:hypothetical protein